MIIVYNTTTKEILATHYGRSDEDAFVSGFSISGQAALKMDDAELINKYLVIDGEGNPSLENITNFSITASKSLVDLSDIGVMDTWYPMTSNGSDYIDFGNIPEGTSLYVDNLDTAAGTADASGIFRFKATEAGLYGIKFWKTGYSAYYVEVKAND